MDWAREQISDALHRIRPHGAPDAMLMGDATGVDSIAWQIAEEIRCGFVHRYRVDGFVDAMHADEHRVESKIRSWEPLLPAWARHLRKQPLRRNVAMSVAALQHAREVLYVVALKAPWSPTNGTAFQLDSVRRVRSVDFAGIKLFVREVTCPAELR